MHSKIQYVFLFLLLLIITTVTIASADINRNISILDPQISLPSLHFDSSQSKVIVTGDLSPAQNFKFVQRTLMTTSQNSEKKSIPFGAIIYHAHNITTVFDATGQQILLTDDNQSEIIHTFKGDSPATFIHEVPNDSVIVERGNILHIFNAKTRILTIIDDDPNYSYIPAAGQTCYGFLFPRLYRGH